MENSPTYEKIYDILHKAINNYNYDLISNESIMQTSKMIMRPPKTSCIRVNTLSPETCNAFQIAKEVIIKQGEPFTIRQHEKFPEILLVDALGPFEVVPKNRIAVVSVECAQSVLRGSHVFTPGLIAIKDDKSKEVDVSIWADLDGKCTRGLRKEYSGRTQFIGNGVLKQNRDQLFCGKNTSKGIAIQVTEIIWKMPSFCLFSKELFYPQNFPSFLTVEELELESNMTVLDMCAAPGGKTSHIAAKMTNQGTLVAIDKNKTKISKLSMTLSDLGVTCVKTFVGDSTKLFDKNGIAPDQLSDSLLPFRAESFDRILLDPPCSGLGQRPILTINDSYNPLLPGFSEYQKRLISVGAKLLKPGGILVYSTCTLTLAENELIVKFALESTELSLKHPLFQYGSEGLPIEGFCNDQVRRFWPSGTDDSIGFFYAKFTKLP